MEVKDDAYWKDLAYDVVEAFDYEEPGLVLSSKLKDPVVERVEQYAVDRSVEKAQCKDAQYYFHLPRRISAFLPATEPLSQFVD